MDRKRLLLLLGTLAVAASLPIVVLPLWSCVPPKGDGETMDFRVGLQISDFGTTSRGEPRWTEQLVQGEGGTWYDASEKAYDGDDKRDPDLAQVFLESLGGEGGNAVKNTDFRLCMKAWDNAGTSEEGIERCTDWASNSTGTSTSAPATDANGYDPDVYQIILRTREWPTDTTDRWVDFRIGIYAYDNGVRYEGGTQWTDWHSLNVSGTSASGWAYDDNGYDPDGFGLKLETMVYTNQQQFCTVQRPCPHGFGDCDGNNECVRGTTCTTNVGNTYGYVNNLIDVCVDNP